MTLHHVALARTSETESDRFFAGLLGLARVGEKRAEAGLCRALFGVAREHRVIDYAGEAARFEVFLVPAGEASPARIAHVCLEADDVEGLAARCARAGLEIRRAAKGERTVTFVLDEDGNLFELKQRATAR
jgi:catechol 2,3-dioxygenase-like lactoylglutathione lyase family enzyme